MISCEVVTFSIIADTLGEVTNCENVRTCREKISMGFFRHGVMQELVQWSGQDAGRLDVEQPCEGFDRLTIPESLPTQSKVITPYLPKEVRPRKTYADAMKDAWRWMSGHCDVTFA